VILGRIHTVVACDLSKAEEIADISVGLSPAVVRSRSSSANGEFRPRGASQNP
jgi:hypothetical protein